MSKKSKGSKVDPALDEARSPESDRVELFEVVLLNCHDGTYHPGQFVEGHVALVMKHNMMTRGITLHFTGLVTLHWTKKVPGKAARCVDTMEYEGAEEYFNVRNYLHEPGPIQADKYRFPFRFHLTPPLPESYEDNICKIEYFLEARLKQDSFTRNDLFDIREILLLSPLDLNRVIIPDVTLPVLSQRVQTVKRWCHANENVAVFMRLERAGYSPGETIRVQADIENDSRREITSAIFSLIEERIYHAEDQVLEHREVITAVTRGPVKPHTIAEWKDINVSIPIGQLFNVSACKIFTIRYFIEMAVRIPRVKKLILTAELALGAIPLERKTLDKPTHQRLQTPAKHQRRPTVAEIEAQKKQELKTRLPRNEDRQRRKVRNRITVRDDETDTKEYRIHAKELDLYKHREKQGYSVPEDID